MSSWLMESGYRTQLSTLHQATEHVTRLVRSAVDAPDIDLCLDVHILTSIQSSFYTMSSAKNIH